MASTNNPDTGGEPGPSATDAPARSATSRARRVAGRSGLDPVERPRPTPKDASAAADVKVAAPAKSPTPATTPPPPKPSRVAAGRAPSAARPAEAPAVVWDGDEATAVVEDAPRTSRSGRNLPVAIAVGAALGALVIGSLFAYRPSFAYIVGIAALYAVWELTQALKTASIRIVLTPLLVGTVVMLAAAWLRGPSGLVVALLVTVLGIAVWRIGDGAHGYTRDTAASTFVVLYVPLLAGFAVLLAHPDDGAARVIAFVATVVCSDTGGLAAGVLFGRHPLAPVVSKAKTWEGFAGSVVACSAAGVLFMIFTFHQEWWKGLLFGLALVVTATLGDLGESMLKRDVGVKDMGRLLPGHGGLMDRLDSLLPCAAVAYLLLSGLVPV